MRGKRLKEIPQEIAELREQIEQWRRTREKQTAMPEELWQAALSLLDKYTLSQVSSRLNISFDGLRMRAMESGINLSHPKGTGNDKAPVGMGEFVMVSPMELFGRQERAESVVELVGAGGKQMTIRVCSQQPIDLVGLIEAFWRHNRCCK